VVWTLKHGPSMLSCQRKKNRFYFDYGFRNSLFIHCFIVPEVSAVPEVSGVSAVPEVSGVSAVPEVSAVPAVPGVSAVPEVSAVSAVPRVSAVDEESLVLQSEHRI
jgi:hypothetical protein